MNIMTKLTELFITYTPDCIKGYKYIDKVYHFIIGLVIGLIALYDPTVCFIISCVIATCKELYDKYYRKTLFDIYDLITTICGSLVMIFIIGVI